MNRRSVASLVIFVFAVGILTVGPAATEEWPQWRGPSQDGAARDTEVFSSPFELALDWSVPIGPGYSGISIAGGLVLTQFSADGRDWVGAYELATGAERWRADLGETYKGRHGSEDGPSSTPAIVEGRVFAAGPHANLVALALEDGRRLWEVDLAGEHGVDVPWYGFGASPVPTGGGIYIAAHSDAGLSGLTFAADDGRLLWSIEGNWLDYQSAVENRGVPGLLVSDSTDLTLVDLESGDERFRFTHTDDGDLAYPQLLPVGDDRVLLTYSTHSDLYRIDAAAEPPLTRLWRSRDLRDAYVPPVADEEAIYGLSGIFLVAVDLETGKRRWKSREPGARNLILVDGHLVLGSYGGEVVVVEADGDGYVEKARVRVSDRGGYTPPSYADSRILIRNTSSMASVRVEAGGAVVAAAESQGSALPPPGAFRDFVAELGESAEPAALLDAWWSAQTSFPIVEGSTVHFVYRGPARDVAIVGDMTEDLYIPESMQRVGGTDLFFRSYEYDPDGLWLYYFLVDAEQVALDPQNERLASGFPEQNPVSVGYEFLGERSVVEMPGWPASPFLASSANGAGGRLETLPFESERAWRKRDLTVYLPAGYDATAQYPVVYVLGGGAWLEYGQFKNAADYLMGSQVESAIAVFVPYHKGSLDRMGHVSYARMLLEEIVPLVEGAYPVGGESVLLAVADDGTAALSAAVRAPERFARVAIHSPRIKPEDRPWLTDAETLPDVFIEWSRYEPRIREDNMDFRASSKWLVESLEQAGVSVTASELAAGPSYPSWSSRLDQSLAFLLPPDTR